MTNEQKVIQLYKGFSERDLNLLTSLCSKNIIWTQNPGFPGGGRNRGVPDIIKNVYEANSKRWKNFTFLRKNISSFKNTVLVEGIYRVQSYNSEQTAEAQTAHVFTFEQGLVMAFQQYTDSKTLWDNYKGNKTNNTPKGVDND